MGSGKGDGPGAVLSLAAGCTAGALEIKGARNELGLSWGSCDTDGLEEPEQGPCPAACVDPRKVQGSWCGGAAPNTPLGVL